jgi:hypothetical protein
MVGLQDAAVGKDHRFVAAATILGYLLLAIVGLALSRNYGDVAFLWPATEIGRAHV